MGRTTASPSLRLLTRGGASQMKRREDHPEELESPNKSTVGRDPLWSPIVSCQRRRQATSTHSSNLMQRLVGGIESYRLQRQCSSDRRGATSVGRPAAKQPCRSTHCSTILRGWKGPLDKSAVIDLAVTLQKKLHPPSAAGSGVAFYRQRVAVDSSDFHLHKTNSFSFPPNFPACHHPSDIRSPKPCLISSIVKRASVQR